MSGYSVLRKIHSRAKIGIWNKSVIERGPLFRGSVLWTFDCIVRFKRLSQAHDKRHPTSKARNMLDSNRIKEISLDNLITLVVRYRAIFVGC